MAGPLTVRSCGCPHMLMQLNAVKCFVMPSMGFYASLVICMLGSTCISSEVRYEG